MTIVPQADPKQWHRPRAWIDALQKQLSSGQPMQLAPKMSVLNAPEVGCETVGSAVLLKLGAGALELRPAGDMPVVGAKLLTAEQLLAGEGTAEGRKTLKLVEEWLRDFIMRAPPPQRSGAAQADYWTPMAGRSDKVGDVPAALDAREGGASRKYRLRLDFLLPTPHLGCFQPIGGSLAEALAAAAQLHWYVSDSFLNVAQRGAYAGRLELLGSGASHQATDAGGELSVRPRYHAWVELGGGRDRLIQAAMELRRLADTLAGEAVVRGEMGLVTDPAPVLSGAVEDVLVWGGSLNWGEQLVLGWEQAGWLREVVDFLVQLHRKRCLKEMLLRTLNQAALWSNHGQAGTVKVVRLLADYFDRHGRNRHFPPDVARRLALSFGRNEKFIRHRPYPARAGLAAVEQLTALAVRLVRLQCGMKRPTRYWQSGGIQNNGLHRGTLRSSVTADSRAHR